jgi:hypothetical protein
MAGRENEAVKQRIRDGIGLIVDSFAPLIDDDFALSGEALLVQTLREAPPLIGFEPQHPFQPACGHGFVVIGVVRVGASVDAGGSGNNNVAAGSVGILTHQVFKQMSEANPPGRFLLGTDGEAQVKMRERRTVIGMQNHLHTVGELVVPSNSILG